MNTGPIFINLSPREEECAACGADILDGNKGIAMHEGEPVAHDWCGDWGGFPCCEGCFAEFERVQAHDGARRVWFSSKLREARLRFNDRIIYAGDLA